MLDLSFDKILVLLVVAAFLIGPKRLPAAAAQLARLATRVRELGGRAREEVTRELGPEFAEVEWRRLDPRQYDPRRIIRDALLEPVETPAERVAREEAFGAAPAVAPAAPRVALPAALPTAAPAERPTPKETDAAGDRPDSDR